MQILFCDIFARVSDFKNLTEYFLITHFFLSQSSISGFSCFKNLYIYRCKKNLHSIEFELNIKKIVLFLLLSERRNYASKELLKFYLMASLKSSNMQRNPVAATLNKPLFYAIRPLRNILSKL